jgi:hypothetical protein
MNWRSSSGESWKGRLHRRTATLRDESAGTIHEPPIEAYMTARKHCGSETAHHTGSEWMWMKGERETRTSDASNERPWKRNPCSFFSAAAAASSVA